MKHRVALGALGLLTCVLVFAACSEDESIPDVRQAIVDSMSQTIILPGFQELADSSAALAATSMNACPVIDSSTLDAMRSGWSEARGAWKRLEPFYFGPHRSPPLRVGQTLDFVPIRAARIEEFISGDSMISGDALKMQGGLVRGFPVLEYLLYAGEPDALTALAQDERRCALAVAVAVDLAYLTGALNSAWSASDGGFITELTNPNTGEFMNSKGALGEIVNRMGYSIENIRRDRLGAPLGDKSGGSIQPDSVESRFSGRSVQDILDVLTILDTLMHGHESADAMGLVDHPSLRSRQDIITRFDEEMRSSRAALAAIPMPLRDSLDDPTLARAAFDALLGVQRSIQGDILNILDLSQTFNDADGD